MSVHDRLVTIARFTSLFEATMARNRLEEAGIASFMVGEETGSALGLVTGLHTVELQVKEDDAFWATGILERDLEPEAGQPASEAIQAPGKIVAPGTKPGLRNAEKDDAEDEEEVSRSREDHAARAFRGAILGCFFWPLQLYVFWLLLKVLLSDEELRPAFRNQALIAALINAPFMLGFGYLLRLTVAG